MNGERGRLRRMNGKIVAAIALVLLLASAAINAVLWSKLGEAEHRAVRQCPQSVTVATRTGELRTFDALGPPIVTVIAGAALVVLVPAADTPTIEGAYDFPEAAVTACR